ncbi:MAG: PilZ domain-containing protein [Bdellovibrionales bacterium]|nr:PilZ domain-containing protein [Bdellovibrionales bacterium]
METSYRKAQFDEEMILLLNDYVHHEWPILLWQAHAKKESRPGIMIEFQPTKKTIRLSFKQGVQGIDINKPLYCKGDEKKIVFKSFSFGNDHNSIKLGIPNDVRLQEHRTNKRYDMTSNKNAFITFSILSHYQSKASSFVLKLKDISENGCSVLMHSSNLKNFKEGDNLKVTQIGSDQVYIPFNATIRHIVPVKTKSQVEVQLYKVGLKFEQSLFFYNYYLTRHLE